MWTAHKFNYKSTEPSVFNNILVFTSIIFTNLGNTGLRGTANRGTFGKKSGTTIGVRAPAGANMGGWAGVPSGVAVPGGTGGSPASSGSSCPSPLLAGAFPPDPGLEEKQRAHWTGDFHSPFKEMRPNTVPWSCFSKAVTVRVTWFWKWSDCPKVFLDCLTIRKLDSKHFLLHGTEWRHRRPKPKWVTVSFRKTCFALVLQG